MDQIKALQDQMGMKQALDLSSVCSREYAEGLNEQAREDMLKQKEELEEELRKMEEELRKFLREQRRSNTALGKIHFRCLTCNAHTQSQPGPSTEAFDESVRLHLNPYEMLDVAKGESVFIKGDNNQLYLGRDGNSGNYTRLQTQAQEGTGPPLLLAYTNYPTPSKQPQQRPHSASALKLTRSTKIGEKVRNAHYQTGTTTTSQRSFTPAPRRAFEPHSISPTSYSLAGTQRGVVDA